MKKGHYLNKDERELAHSLEEEWVSDLSKRTRNDMKNMPDIA
jgi:hypothetical protein